MLPRSPKLSIIIPSHQRTELLRACLRSVLQHAPQDAEILVIDDASPGHAVSRTASTFASVRVLRLARQSGFCVAANAGIRAASGSIVELLNDDTEVTAGWAEAALGHFQDPGVAAVAPLVLYWRPPGERSEPPRIDSAGDLYYLGGVAGKRGHGRLLEPRFLRGGRVFGASASSAFFRRAALLQVGAFPESFGAYFEDVDLAFRLHGASYQVVYEPASRIFHHVSASYGCPQSRLLEQQSRNEERVFWRNTPTQALPHALPRHFAVLAAKAWRRWREGNLTSFVRGRLGVLREIPTLARHRRWLRQVHLHNLLAWHVEPCFWGHLRPNQFDATKTRG